MNIQEYIWNNNSEFYLSKNQEKIYEKIKDFKVSGPIHIGGNEGNGKTFLARRLLDENSIYLPIHNNIDKFFLRKYSIIILDNIKHFHADIILKIKRSIQQCKLLIILSENYLKDLSTEVKAFIRRYYDLDPPDFNELQEFAVYILDLFKIKQKQFPNSIKNFSELINWIENVIKN